MLFMAGPIICGVVPLQAVNIFKNGYINFNGRCWERNWNTANGYILKLSKWCILRKLNFPDMYYFYIFNVGDEGK